MIKNSISRTFFYCAALTLLFGSLPAFAQGATQLNLGPNLAQDGGFENGAAAWHIPQNSAKVVSNVAHSGSHSFFYSNTNPKRYRLFTQKINVKPG